MRKLLLLAVLAAGGVVAASNTARADGTPAPWPIQIPEYHRRHAPKTTSVTWPSVTPPGWYSDTYRYKWYIPWYAYYNSSSGPYANWMAGGGYAGYANHGPAGMYYSHKQPTEPYIGEWYNRTQGTGGLPAGSTPVPDTMPKKDEKPKDKEDKGSKVTVTLPPDAKLLFNGVAASGTGNVRTFQTPPLVAGQVYKYELTAEVVRGGQTERATGTVIIRAGETASVALTPIPVAVVTASK